MGFLLSPGTGPAPDDRESDARARETIRSEAGGVNSGQLNPGGWSFSHWILETCAGGMAVKALAGALLRIGWILGLRAAAVSLGLLGAVLLAVLMATVVWMLFEYHIIDSAGRPTLVWIGLGIAGILPGIGLSWFLVRAKPGGHIEVDWRRPCDGSVRALAPKLARSRSRDRIRAARAPVRRCDGGTS